MTNRALGLLLAVLLLLPSLARSQGIVVHLFAKHEDEPIEEIIEVLEIGGDFEVEIDPALRTRKVTVEFKGETPLAALRLLARTVKAEVTPNGAGKYRLTPLAPGADPGATKKEPAWVKAAREKLLATDVKDVEDVKLSVLLADLSRASGVAVYLDPQVERVRSAEQRNITMTTLGTGPSSAMSTILGACGWAKLEHDFRWGGVFVTTPDRMRTLPATGLPAAAKLEGDAAKIRKTLAEKKITATLRRSGAGAALTKIARLGGVKLRYASKDLRKLDRVDLRVKNLPAGDVLDAILVPRGLIAGFEGGVLVVTPVAGR